MSIKIRRRLFAPLPPSPTIVRMKTIFLAWELGGGLGHLTNLLPLVEGFHKQGHRVVAALKDLSAAPRLFAGLDVAYLQAPHKTRKADRPIEPPRTFAHILHNSGFGELDELRALVAAWRGLFDYTRPDLIIFDHSPTALLAAQSFSAKRAVIGCGFCCPVDEFPLRDLRDWLPDASAQLKQEEDRVLANVNQIQAAAGQPPLPRLASLYRRVDENFLTTFPELDHFPGRQGTEYWGPGPNLHGKPPVWPAGPGKRIYAYLKPFPALPQLLAMLGESRCPTLVYAGGIPEELQKRFSSPSVRFEREPLDLGEVGRQCDLAILNGTSATTASLLLSGRPILQIPLYLEQVLVLNQANRSGFAWLAG
jgi:hypothetical protein